MESPEEINVFAETNFRNQRTTFGIKTDDRRRHMYVIGKTGMGKSHLLRHMAYNDVQSGKGLAFVDPHGDSADWLLEYIPTDRINDVVYINPTDVDFPIAFNVLEKVDRRYHNLVADGLIGVFKKIWAESWGPRLEYLLRNAILALLYYQDSTLLGVTRLLIDKAFRKKVIPSILDPVVKAFWVDEFSRYNDRFLVEAIAPIQNKVGQFLSNAVIRNIVGQPKSTIDMREIMDAGKILVVNLSKGKIGEESSALLGAMLVTKIQLAAMSRADVPEEERRDFVLYVDEFQTFATESFADILSEARKYRLSLIMAHQYIEQMPETVASAVFGNVGTLVSFRVSAADAEILEKEFEPVFMQNDFVNLPKYHFYVKLMIDGIAGEGFSANTVPFEFEPNGNNEKVIRVSRERYANPREEVEEKISRWSGVFDAKDIPDEEKPKPKFVYTPQFKSQGGRRPDRGGRPSGGRKPLRRQGDRQSRDHAGVPPKKAVPKYDKPKSATLQQRSAPQPVPKSSLKPSQRSVTSSKSPTPPATGQSKSMTDSKDIVPQRPRGWNPPKPPSVPQQKSVVKSPREISLDEAVAKSPQKMHQSKSDKKTNSVSPGEKVKPDKPNETDA
ncbi:helicase HerA domain-containing protein [Patescibacteria group bacterium]